MMYSTDECRPVQERSGAWGASCIGLCLVAVTTFAWLGHAPAQVVQHFATTATTATPLTSVASSHVAIPKVRAAPLNPAHGSIVEGSADVHVAPVAPEYGHYDFGAADPATAPTSNIPMYSFVGALTGTVALLLSKVAAARTQSDLMLPLTDPLSRRQAFQAAAVGLTLPALGAMAAEEGRPEITDRVYLKVRIARQDGSNDLRDDAPDQPYMGTIVLGLYGKEAPLSTAKFLKYSLGERPSFQQSNFFRLTDGLVEGGRIGGLTVTQLAGNTAISYAGQVLPGAAPLALDLNGLKHDRRGLLTHPKLEASPEFGITLSAKPDLDSSNVVFGEVIGGEEFLSRVELLPVLMDATPGPMGDWLAGQKQGYRKLAELVGDDRVKKVYPNKLLRRVDVSECGILAPGQEPPSSPVAMFAMSGSRRPMTSFSSINDADHPPAPYAEEGCTVRVCAPVTMYHVPKMNGQPVDIEGCMGTVVGELTFHDGKVITANYPFRVKVKVDIPDVGVKDVLCHLLREEFEVVADRAGIPI